MSRLCEVTGVQIISQPDEGGCFIGKRAVELGFEGGVQDGFEFGAGGKTGGEQVAAEENGLRRGGLQVERAGAGAEFFDEGVGFGRVQGRSAGLSAIITAQRSSMVAGWSLRARRRTMESLNSPFPLW